jgi:hypothetical protein
MSLTPGRRARVEEYVRPLYTELDGVDTFSQVEEIERRLARLAPGVRHHPELLELMVLFHGVVARLGSLARGGRWQLFVRGLGLADGDVARLRSALGRYAESPRTPEEELLHDAVLLGRTGVRAVVTRLLAAGRRRAPLERALAQIDSGPDPERFRTPAGRELAVVRQSAAIDWIARLRASVAEEEIAEVSGATVPRGRS